MSKLESCLRLNRAEFRFCLQKFKRTMPPSPKSCIYTIILTLRHVMWQSFVSLLDPLNFKVIEAYALHFKPILSPLLCKKMERKIFAPACRAGFRGDPGSPGP